VAADIAIDPGGRSRIDKINRAGIHDFKFDHQFPLLAQLIFLVVILGQVKFGKGQDFGLNLYYIDR